MRREKIRYSPDWAHIFLSEKMPTSTGQEKIILCSEATVQQGKEYVDKHKWEKAPSAYTSFAKALCKAELKSVSELLEDAKKNLAFDNDGLSIMKIDAPSPFTRTLAASGYTRDCTRFHQACLTIVSILSSDYLARNLMQKKKFFVFHIAIRKSSHSCLVRVKEGASSSTQRRSPGPLRAPLFLLALLIWFTTKVEQRRVRGFFPSRKSSSTFLPSHLLKEICTGLLSCVPGLDTLRTRFFYFGGSLRKTNVSTDNAMP